MKRTIVFFIVSAVLVIAAVATLTILANNKAARVSAEKGDDVVSDEILENNDADSTDETKPFPGLAVLHDERYVVRQSDLDAIAALKPYKPNRVYRQSDAMTEDAPYRFYEQADEMQPWFVDADGRLYISARQSVKVKEDRIFAFRVLNEAEGRQLLDAEGLDQIDEYETFVLMHLLAAYPRMRVHPYYIEGNHNYYYAIQGVLYFTDEHVVNCSMEASAPFYIHEYETPYGTSIRVSPYAGNEWAERPWLEYAENEYEQYILRVLETLCVYW